MTAKAAADIAAVLGAYDFARFDTIADIGGGRGHLLRAVLDAVPTAEGILFDLPHVIESLDLDLPPALRPTGRLLRRSAATRRRLRPDGGDP